MPALTSALGWAGKKALAWGKRELVRKVTRGKLRTPVSPRKRHRKILVGVVALFCVLLMLMQMVLVSMAASKVAAGQKLLSFVPDYSVAESGLSEQELADIQQLWESEDFLNETADTFTCLTAANGSIESVLYDSYAQITHLPAKSIRSDEMIAWLLYRAGEITARAATVYAIPELRAENDPLYTAEELATFGQTYDFEQFIALYNTHASPSTNPVDVLNTMFPENGGRWSFSQYMPQARALVLREAMKTPSVLSDAATVQSTLVEQSLSQCEQFEQDIAQGTAANAE